MNRHLILIGLPGSGKSTVGPLVASELGCQFMDLDRRIEASSGSTVTEIFATQGERAFRELEREAMDAVLAATPAVVAPGGGWAAQPGNVAAVEGRAVLVYLAIPPEVAARRLLGDASRPLLAGTAHPAETLARMLEAREAFYRLADLEVDAAAGPPELVAAGVVAAFRRSGVAPSD